MVRSSASAGLLVLTIGVASAAKVYSVHKPSDNSKVGVPFDGFVSYSIEFSSFPEFAGKCAAASRHSRSSTLIQRT